MGEHRVYGTVSDEQRHTFTHAVRRDIRGASDVNGPGIDRTRRATLSRWRNDRHTMSYVVTVRDVASRVNLIVPERGVPMSEYKRLLLALAAVALVAWVGPTAIATETARDPTRQTGTGPEYQPNSASTIELWQPGDPGERLNLKGRVLSTAGKPLAGATVELWQADGAGSYRQVGYRATLQTADDGTFRVKTVVPGQRAWKKHIHVRVNHEGYEPLATQILFKGDPHMNEARDGDLAILLEEVKTGSETVMVGGVEFVLRPAGGS